MTQPEINLSKEKVLLLLNHAEISSQSIKLLESATQDNTRLTALVPDFGTASKWMAEQGVYSFLNKSTDCKSSRQRMAETLQFLQQHGFTQLIFSDNSTEPHFAQAFKLLNQGNWQQRQLDSAVILELKSKSYAMKSVGAAMTNYLLYDEQQGLTRRLYLGLKRSIESLLCFMVLLLLSPILALLLLLKVGTIAPKTILGQANRKRNINILARTDAKALENQVPGWWLPALWNVCTGELSLIGPRIVSLEADNSAFSADLYYQLAPGLISRSNLKASEGLSPAQLDELDQAYMVACNPILDCKIMLLALLKLVKL